MSNNIVEVTSMNFDDITKQTNVIVLDFWAQWCVPCKGFAEVIKQVAPEYPHVTFGSIDIESETDLAKEFQIRSVPMVMILRNRHVIYAQSGALTNSALKGLLVQAEALPEGNLK